MNKSFLLTAPQYDDTTAYCSAWCKDVIETAELKGFQIVQLEKENAVRIELEKRIKKHEPVLVMFNGHGNQKSVWGQNNEILIQVHDNEHLLGGKIVYAFTCSSLAELGKSAVEKGTLAYIGYRFPYVFYFDKSYCSTPLKDKTAKSFFDPSNRIVISLIKGAPVHETIKRSQESIEKEIALWKTIETPDAEWVRSALHLNKVSLGFEGNGQAELES